MAPPSRFSKDQDTWIKATFPEFENQLELLQRRFPRQDGPPHDATVKAWIDSRCEEFEKEFGSQLDSITGWNSKLRRKFSNHKRDMKAPKTADVAAKPVDSTPLFLHPDSSVTRARDLFHHDHSDEIKEEATKRRATLGQDSKHHLGHLQTVLKEYWAALSEEKKSEYMSRAAEITRKQVVTDSKDIFENQKKLLPSLYTMLNGTIGHGINQIGSAAFHLLYGYRDSDDQLQLGILDIACSSDDCSFQAFVPDYPALIRARWQAYCNKYITSNREDLFELTFTKDTKGHYLLPQFDEENEKISDFRTLVKQFFDASWGTLWSRSHSMSGFPWSDFIAHPSDYLDSRLISPDNIIGHPDTLAAYQLLSFAATISAFQSDALTTNTSIFRTREDIEAAHTKRRVSVLEPMIENPSIHMPTTPSKGYSDKSSSVPHTPIKLVVTAHTTPIGTPVRSRPIDSPKLTSPHLTPRAISETSACSTPVVTPPRSLATTDISHAKAELPDPPHATPSTPRTIPTTPKNSKSELFKSTVTPAPTRYPSTPKSLSQSTSHAAIPTTPKSPLLSTTANMHPMPASVPTTPRVISTTRDDWGSPLTPTSDSETAGTKRKKAQEEDDELPGPSNLSTNKRRKITLPPGSNPLGEMPTTLRRSMRHQVEPENASGSGKGLRGRRGRRRGHGKRAAF